MSASPPYWQIDIQKRLGNEYWTNVYHTARSNQAAAQEAADSLVVMEIALHSTDVTIVSYSVRPFPGPSEGTITAVGENGTNVAPNYLPLFNVARVDFPAPTGRPSRKFYRIPLDNSWVVDGVLTPVVRGALQSRIDDYFADPGSAGLIDVDGQLLVSGVVQGPVGMRQLRRGSRRRTTPVIPVS